MKNNTCSQGFTLVELMVVIIVIGILSSIAIPKFMDISIKAKLSEIPVVFSAYEHAQLSYLSEHGNLAASTADLLYDQPKSKWFVYTLSGGGGSDAVYTVNLKPGIKIGPFDNSSSASVTISAASTVTRNAGVFGEKYLPNFSD
jgi:prepilin-type N-terminal cleavage/methylation domain-containing protein